MERCQQSSSKKETEVSDDKKIKVSRKVRELLDQFGLHGVDIKISDKDQGYEMLHAIARQFELTIETVSSEPIPYLIGFLFGQQICDQHDVMTCDEMQHCTALSINELIMAEKSGINIKQECKEYKVVGRDIAKMVMTDAGDMPTAG